MSESKVAANLFVSGNFILHSGDTAAWKIDCDALSDQDISALAIIARDALGPHALFGDVVGIPRGGLRMAEAMRQYLTPGARPVLIVDDVLTTGRSVRKKRDEINAKGVGVLGLVIFARTDAEPWVTRLFQM